MLAEAILQRLPVGKGLRVHPDALLLLEGYDYPGNIRELRNILERAALLADDTWIRPEHLPPSLQKETDLQTLTMPEAVPGVAGIIPLAELEERYLRWASQSHPGDRRSLAQRLGVSERTLYRKLDAIRGQGVLTGPEHG